MLCPGPVSETRVVSLDSSEPDLPPDPSHQFLQQIFWDETNAVIK